MYHELSPCTIEKITIDVNFSPKSEALLQNLNVLQKNKVPPTFPRQNKNSQIIPNSYQFSCLFQKVLDN